MEAGQKLLRIYTDEAAYFGDRRVYEIVLIRAREARLAGFTALQALIGSGRSTHVHARHVLDDDQSIVIEIVDQEARLRAFASSLGDLPEIGLITLEQVEVLRQDPAGRSEPPQA